MWFNGWIEKHKFGEDAFEGVTFEAYVKEPPVKPGRRRISPWDIKEDNIVCLAAEESFEFGEEELEVLGMIQNLARKNSEVG